MITNMPRAIYIKRFGGFQITKGKINIYIQLYRILSCNLNPRDTYKQKLISKYDWPIHAEPIYDTSV